MKRAAFIRLLALSVLPAVGKSYGKRIRIRFWRHATLVMEIGGKHLLVDPMLSVKGEMDPVKVARNSSRIPMVELPMGESDLMDELHLVDGVILTHTHRDHWDERARKLLKKDVKLFCQPADVATLKGQGFTNFSAVDSVVKWEGLTIHRTGGRHGTGEIGKRMGTVSGFVVEALHHKIYVAGDTIWCPEVEKALAEHTPDCIVVNAGAARFDDGDPITMTAADVTRVCDAVPSARIVAVHMEAVNHCDLTREELRKSWVMRSLARRCVAPEDGDVVPIA